MLTHSTHPTRAILSREFFLTFLRVLIRIIQRILPHSARCVEYYVSDAPRLECRRTADLRRSDEKRIMQVTLTLQDYLTQDILELTQARTVVDAVTQIVEEWIAAKKSPVPTADDSMFDIDALSPLKRAFPT